MYFCVPKTLGIHVFLDGIPGDYLYVWNGIQSQNDKVKLKSNHETENDPDVEKKLPGVKTHQNVNHLLIHFITPFHCNLWSANNFLLHFTFDKYISSDSENDHFSKGDYFR